MHSYIISYIKTAGIKDVVVKEAPALGISLVIAELFFKFHSFTLECLTFLATWFVLSWLTSKVLHLIR